MLQKITNLVVASIFFGVLLTISFGISTFGPANAEVPKVVSWIVPAGVSQIRVTSVTDGKNVLDTVINVKPGQTFKVEAVK